MVEANTIEIITMIAAIISMLIACCTPLVTACANIIVFGALRTVKLYLAPEPPTSGITRDDQLVCEFRPRNGLV